MSIIAAGTTTTTALTQTGNTDGTIQLQVNGTTPSVTLNALGAVGVGSTPGYGTTGQVLTSSGSTSAPTWATPTPVSGSGGATASGNVTLTAASGGAQSITTTDYGQYVKLPDATTMSKAAQVFNITNAGAYPLKVLNSASTLLGFVPEGQSVGVGLADSSTAAGVWNIQNIQPLGMSAFYSASSLLSTNIFIPLDANKTLCLNYNGTSSIYAIVYDASTNTWGTNTAVRTNGGSALTVVLGYAISSSSVLVVSSANTAIEGVVLSISGTTVTTNTAATSTASITVGTSVTPTLAYIPSAGSFVFVWQSSGAVQKYMNGITVSGTTVTIGTQFTASTGVSHSLVVNATGFSLVYYDNASVIRVNGYSISGTTITAGTATTTSANNENFQIYNIATDKWMVLYTVTNSFQAFCFTASGSSVTKGTAVALATPAVSQITPSSSNAPYFGVVGTKLAGIVNNSSNNATYAVYITNTTGTTITWSTALQVPTSATPRYMFTSTSGTTATFISSSSTGVAKLVIDVSTSTPTISQYKVLTGGNLTTPQLYNPLAISPPARGAQTVLPNAIGTNRTYVVGSGLYFPSYSSSGFFGATILNAPLPSNFSVQSAITGYDANSMWVDITGSTYAAYAIARIDAAA